MKIQSWFLALLITLLYSCQPRIKNDLKTLDKVFNMTEFDIEIIDHSCLTGSNKEYFSVKKIDSGFIIKSNKTSKSHFVQQVKMDTLKKFLKAKIDKEISGGCTSGQYIRIGTWINSIDYEHRHCGSKEARIINDLLNYYELINETESKK